MLKDREDARNIIIEKLFEAKNVEKSVVVSWSKAKLVSKTSENIFPNILVPLIINGDEPSFGTIAFVLWGGTVMSYQVRYGSRTYFLEKFDFNEDEEKYRYTKEIPLKEFKETLNINPNKYQKKMNDILIKNLKEVWRGYSIDIEGSLSKELVEDLVSAMAMYYRIK